MDDHVVADCDIFHQRQRDFPPNATEADFDKHADEITEAPEVKVMKRIRCRGSALEACVTRHGTIVGPRMTELVGFKELTPYRGGWCGNEVFAGAFDAKSRAQARAHAMAFGEELRRMGYKGYFELDFLTDLDSNRVYLGECNPRITGASSMTNHAAFAHAAQIRHRGRLVHLAAARRL